MTIFVNSWEKVSTILKESTLLQIIVFNKKTVAKISWISNLKSPPWNLVKFCTEFFLVNVSRIMCSSLWIDIKTIKAHGLYDNVHLHCFSICFKTQCVLINRNLGEGDNFTKLENINKTTSKKFDDKVMSTDCDVIVIFLIYGQFGAIRKPDSGGRVCKTYIFINRNLLFYKNWKQN